MERFCKKIVSLVHDPFLIKDGPHAGSTFPCSSSTTGDTHESSAFRQASHQSATSENVTGHSTVHSTGRSSNSTAHFSGSTHGAGPTIHLSNIRVPVGDLKVFAAGSVGPGAQIHLGNGAVAYVGHTGAATFTPVDISRPLQSVDPLFPKGTPNFVGREALVETIKDHFLGQSRSIFSTVALSGLSGVGKTETGKKIALELVDMQRSPYSILWKVKGKSRESVMADLRRLAENIHVASDLTLSDMIVNINRALGRMGRALILVDGMNDSPLFSMLDGLQCDCIVTTQTKSGMPSNWVCRDVVGFDGPTAVSFFKARFSAEAFQFTEASILPLVQKTGGLPAVFSVIAGFLSQNSGFDSQRLTALFSQDPSSFLVQPTSERGLAACNQSFRPDSPGIQALDIVYNMLLDQLEPLHPDILPMMAALSVFDADEIPLFLCQHFLGKNELETRQFLTILSDRSVLIWHKGHGTTLSIHPLVHLVAKQRYRHRFHGEFMKEFIRKFDKLEERRDFLSRHKSNQLLLIPHIIAGREFLKSKGEDPGEIGVVLENFCMDAGNKQGLILLGPVMAEFSMSSNEAMMLLLDGELDKALAVLSHNVAKNRESDIAGQTELGLLFLIAGKLDDCIKHCEADLSLDVLYGDYTLYYSVVGDYGTYIMPKWLLNVLSRVCNFSILVKGIVSATQALVCCVPKYAKPIKTLQQFKSLPCAKVFLQLTQDLILFEIIHLQPSVAALFLMYVSYYAKKDFRKADEQLEKLQVVVDKMRDIYDTRINTDKYRASYEKQVRSRFDSPLSEPELKRKVGTQFETYQKMNAVQHSLVGYLLMFNGEKQQAKRFFETAFAIHPNHVNAKRMLKAYEQTRCQQHTLSLSLGAACVALLAIGYLYVAFFSNHASNDFDTYYVQTCPV